MSRQVAFVLGGGAISEPPTLAVPFQCAACVERAVVQWFSSGPIVDAILATASVPGYGWRQVINDWIDEHAPESEKVPA